MPERIIGLVLKTRGGLNKGVRGFESYYFLQMLGHIIGIILNLFAFIVIFIGAFQYWGHDPFVNMVIWIACWKCFLDSIRYFMKATKSS